VPADPITSSDWIVLGRVAGLYGLSGWVKLISHTQNRSDLFVYNPLYLGHDDGWQPLAIEEARAHGKGLIAKFLGYDDRDAAVVLVGRDIAVHREQLPPLGPEEYYWADLIGLQVINQDGLEFGTIAYLLATGANDVIVVKGERERLLPFIKGDVVVEINLDQNVMRVNWDSLF
jgi:16S rRNA processing protein RimM